MSLVVVVRTKDDDLLFVADKRISDVGAGQVGHAVDNAVKLHQAFGGVVGFAGNPNIGHSLLGEIISIKKHLNEAEMSIELGNLYAKHMLPMINLWGREAANAKLNSEAVEFVFGINNSSGCRVTTFERDLNFTENTYYNSVHCATLNEATYDNVVIIGLNLHARMLRQLLKKENYTLEEAKRLAGMMIHVTNEADPSSVGKDIDALLLTKKSPDPQIIDMSIAMKWVVDFVSRMRGDFFETPTSPP